MVGNKVYENFAHEAISVFLYYLILYMCTFDFRLAYTLSTKLQNPI
jgi:hypothetical protein